MNRAIFGLLLGGIPFPASGAAPPVAPSYFPETAAAPGLVMGVDVFTGADLLTGRSILEMHDRWIRVEGLEAYVGDDAKSHAARDALRRLHENGMRVVGLVQAGSRQWRHGLRPPAFGNRLPADLNEVVARASEIANAFGNSVDVWEFSNEPDISFVSENPETYTSYLKACWWGVAHSHGFALIRLPRVMMAPLALPPGPYFESFVANDGLSYTDAFNYHFYGYTEDFTGVYQQFKAATRALSVMDPAVLRPGTSVWSTRFFPSADGWTAARVGEFAFDVSDNSSAARRLAQRPLAREEPPLSVQGRWLVSQGITVEEVGNVWRFTIRHWPDGPIRAPVAELPLPDGWPSGTLTGPFPPQLRDSLLSFEYRRTDGDWPRIPAPAAIDPMVVKRGAGVSKSRLAELRGSEPPLQPVGGQPRSTKSLPVFLTEYGYGSLDKVTRTTAEGRARQQAWFSDVSSQIRRLGIEGAMAFVLTPCLERDLSEFGLLMNEPLPGQAAGERFGSTPFYASPAFQEIARSASEPVKRQYWHVAASRPNPVVIDFIPGKGLGQAKSYGGYFLERQAGRSFPAEGALVLYNFGDEMAEGVLRLSGDSWQLAGGAGRRIALRLAPGERRELPVEIRPTVQRFVACDVGAEFAQGPVSMPVEETRTALSPAQAGASANAQGDEAPRPVPPPPRNGPLNMFECYFRTANGNLYQTWPRLLPSSAWQVYQQRVENFTMAFYGRANLPWRFTDNRPVSLVFFFHPDEFPVVYEVRGAQMMKFAAPAAVPEPGKR